MHEAGHDIRPRFDYHRCATPPMEAMMDDDTMTAIADLRRRVEELEDELDLTKTELRNLTMRVNRLE